MMLTGKELVDIAINIEVNGAAFYESLAASVADAAARTMYHALAGKEREHMERFRSLLSRASEYSPSETYTEEYDAYLRALVDSLVFGDDQAARDMGRGVSSDLEAVQIGIGAEKESILFYLELRGLVRRADAELVNSIIEEERSHLRELSALKRTLVG